MEWHLKLYLWLSILVANNFSSFIIGTSLSALVMATVLATLSLSFSLVHDSAEQRTLSDAFLICDQRFGCFRNSCHCSWD